MVVFHLHNFTLFVESEANLLKHLEDVIEKLPLENAILLKYAFFLSFFVTFFSVS